MNPIRTILVPTDFSDFAVHAFLQALDLARRQHAEIHLLHVSIELNTYTWDSVKLILPQDEKEIRTSIEEDSRRQLDAFLAGYDTDGVPIVPAMQWGHATAPAIVAYAKEHDIDLIVMGSHGRRGVERLLLGSVTGEVAHTASCPVLVVHASQAQAPAAVQRILVPLDFSMHNTQALEWAGTLASGYAARLILLHVMEGFFPSEYGAFGDSFVPKLTPEIEARAREEMARLAALATMPGVAVESHLQRGYPAGDIVDYAAAQDIDLIVMASHGRAGLKRFLLGSVAEKVMRAAPCPVLVVKV